MARAQHAPPTPHRFHAKGLASLAVAAALLLVAALLPGCDARPATSAKSPRSSSNEPIGSRGRPNAENSLAGNSREGVSQPRAFSSRSGWRLEFTGGFSGPAGSTVKQSKWTFVLGPGRRFGTGEIETATSSTSNVYLNGHGTLVIRALENASDKWTSGRIRSRERFSAPKGGELLVTAEIKQPDPRNGLGYWPAFWLLGKGHWPEHGEIDIMEDVNALSSASHTLHCGVDPGGPCHEPTGITSKLRPVPGSQTSFLRYSVVIDRRVSGHAKIEWFIGSRKVYQVEETRVPRRVWREAVDGSFTVILDLAIGGSYPDGVAHRRTRRLRPPLVAVWRSESSGCSCSHPND